MSVRVKKEGRSVGHVMLRSDLLFIYSCQHSSSRWSPPSIHRIGLFHPEFSPDASLDTCVRCEIEMMLRQKSKKGRDFLLCWSDDGDVCRSRKGELGYSAPFTSLNQIHSSLGSTFSCSKFFYEKTCTFSADLPLFSSYLYTPSHLFILKFLRIEFEVHRWFSFQQQLSSLTSHQETSLATVATLVHAWKYQLKQFGLRQVSHHMSLSLFPYLTICVFS